uniref:Uncharacterized protein n=1 Tax=Cacopsylla melanoneura TaxID=428564 RepID=A0A8D9EZS2_9HEMI
MGYPVVGLTIKPTWKNIWFEGIPEVDISFLCNFMPGPILNIFFHIEMVFTNVKMGHQGCRISPTDLEPFFPHWSIRDIEKHFVSCRNSSVFALGYEAILINISTHGRYLPKFNNLINLL